MTNIITKISLMCLGLFVALTSGTLANRTASGLSFSDDDLIVGARAIVTGRVLSTACRLDSDDDRIFTYIKIRVAQTLKGDIGSRDIVLKEEGGEAEGQGSMIFGTPSFSVGERVFLYLDTWPDGSLRVHQMSFGKLSVVDSGGGRETLVRAEQSCGAMLERMRHHPHSVDSPSDSPDFLEYTRVVQTRLEALANRSRAFQLEHYSDVRLLHEPPEYQEAIARREIHPQFNLLYPETSVRWFEPDNHQPITFYINPEGAPNAQVIENVDAALTAWSNVEGSALRLVNGGPRNVCSTQRTVNVIAFNNCDGRFAPSAADCSRIIALGGLRWTSGVTRLVNGQTYVPAEYAFISFNPYSFCSFANNCDLREVATHELGHALGLGHAQHLEATMFGSAHSDGRCASLTEDDVNGIAFVYPINDRGSRPLAIESVSPLPNAVKLIGGIVVLTSSGGVLPHTWSVVDFLGRPPTNMSLSSSGIIFGSPSETGTFSFTVQVNDGAGDSLQRRFSMTVREPLQYDSQFIMQTIVPPVRAGQQFSVLMKWLNSGSEFWDASVKPAAQNPANNTTWRASVAPSAGFTLKGLPREIRLTAIAPRTAGTYDFQWQLFQEGRGFFGQPSANLKITVLPGPPSIDSPDPPQGYVGSPFVYQLTVGGGTPPFVWTIANGSLPSGLGLDRLTGLISGIPTAIGNSSFTAQVTDSESRSFQKQYSVTVAPASTLLRLNVAASLQTVVGAPVNYQPEATGGTPPYDWSLTTGALPSGMAFNVFSGALSGTAAVSGEYNITISVRDQRAQSASGSIQIRVIEPEPPPVITKVKYRVGKGKLVVSGDRIAPNAILLVDGVQVSGTLDSGVLIAKHVALASGSHQIRVVNPSGVSSQAYSITVE